MILLSLAWSHFCVQLKAGRNLLWLLVHSLLTFYLLLLSLSSASIQTYLSNNLQQLLGAATVLISQSPLDQDLLEALPQYAQRIAHTQVFDLNLTHQQNWQRVEVKAVDQQYPIRGEIRLAKALGAVPEPRSQGPNPGEIWLDPRAMVSLQTSVGQSLTLGQHAWQITGVLTYEPDRLLQSHSVAMRAMLHADDLALLTLPEDVTYRVLLDNNRAQQLQLEAWLQQHYPHVTVISDANGKHPLAALWQRVENFVGLAGALLFALGVLCLQLSARSWITHQRYFLAIGMSNGLRRGQALWVAINYWLISLCVAMLPATLLAITAAKLGSGWLVSFFPGMQFTWHLDESVATLAICVGLFALLQIPTWFAIAQIKVLDLIRGQSAINYHGAIQGVVVVAGVSALLYLYSDNGLLTTLLLVILAAAVLLMALFSAALLLTSHRVLAAANGLLPFAVYLMRQRLLAKTAQIVGLGLCLALYIVAARITVDFTDMFKQSSRQLNGNVIITQASQADVSAIQMWATQQQADVRHLRPFRYAQLVSVNDMPMHALSTGPSETHSTLEQAIRLSWSRLLPDNNRLTSGAWQTATSSGAPGLSVEDEVAEDLQLALGDRLTFMISGQSQQFEVTSTHAFKPGTHSITFWFVVPGAVASGLEFVQTPTFMGSMELPDSAWPALAELWRSQPALRLLPIKELAMRIDNITQISRTVVLTFNGFVTLLVILVIIAAIQRVTHRDRKRNGLFMSFGLNQRQCWRICAYEWLMTAGLATIGATVTAWVFAEVLYQSQFGLNYPADWYWHMLTSTAMIVVVTLVGLGFNTKALRNKVLDLLQENTR